MCALVRSELGDGLEAGLSPERRSEMRPEPSLFDRNPDPALDELSELAAVLCGADFAYLAWMDYNRLWYKARFGFKASDQPRDTTHPLRFRARIATPSPQPHKHHHPQTNDHPHHDPHRRPPRQILFRKIIPALFADSRILINPRPA